MAIPELPSMGPHSCLLDPGGRGVRRSVVRKADQILDGSTLNFGVRVGCLSFFSLVLCFWPEIIHCEEVVLEFSKRGSTLVLGCIKIEICN